VATLLHNVITLIDNKPVIYFVVCNEVGLSSRDLLGTRPFKYDFNEAKGGIGLSFYVEVTDILHDLFFDNNDYLQHNATIQFGLRCKRESPENEGFLFTTDEYKKMIESPAKDGEELGLEILSFIYQINKNDPTLGISIYDLMDNLCDEEKLISNWVHHFVEREFLVKLENLQSYRKERGHALAVSYKVNPKRTRETKDYLIEEGILGLDGKYESSSKIQVSNNLKDMKYDAFICHASEDKKEIVNELAKSLKSHELNIWYDDFILEVGDSLTKCIEDGLRNSRYGIAILSHNFLRKNWPDSELRSLMISDINGKAKILPILHSITHEEISEKYPLLKDKYALQTTEGITTIVKKLVDKIKK